MIALPNDPEDAKGWVSARLFVIGTRRGKANAGYVAASGLSRYSGEYLNRPFIDADNKAFYEKRGGVSGNAKPDT
jgi:hypothetical protein